MLGKRHNVVDQSASLRDGSAASARPREERLLVGGAALGCAAALVLGCAPAGTAWQAAGLVAFAAAGFLTGQAATSTGIRLLRRRLQEARELVAAQRAEIACYAELLDHSDLALIALSADGVITDWSPAATRLYGYARDEVVGRPLTVITPDAALDILEETAELAPRSSTTFETVHLRKDETPVQVSLTLTRTTERPAQMVAIARNISAQKAFDAESHQESKLESLGRLAAGLAHEINSPIQFVGDNARFLEEAYQELIRVVEVYRALLDTSSPIGWMERQERVREAEAGIDFEYLQEEIPSAVEQTLEGIERVSTIVRAMKTFSHPGHREQAPADLNEALAATVTVTRHQINDVADLNLDLAPLPPVRCNIADLNQVFLNLIVNAADAIEETGRRGVITVATALDGDDVVVRIGDTGCGIPDDVRSKMFDPFFTTKDVGRGSGQGLPLVRGVVQEGHGGSVSVDSVVGQGTTFTVRIPIDGLQDAAVDAHAADRAGDARAEQLDRVAAA
ncbi:MAG: Two component multi-sensor signal transduction histidine kinase [Blastococcus sp.]|nr:Two component multi-sensor signal transduction histidine kinase [Blastococcus sp.]